MGTRKANLNDRWQGARLDGPAQGRVLSNQQDEGIFNAGHGQCEYGHCPGGYHFAWADLHRPTSGFGSCIRQRVVRTAVSRCGFASTPETDLRERRVAATVGTVIIVSRSTGLLSLSGPLRRRTQ